MPRPDSMPPHPALQPYARSAQIAGRRLFFYDSDSAPDARPPIVLIHGLGDEADTWQAVLPALARWRRVLALDLPGFGRSEGPRSGATLAFYARTIAELLWENGITQAVLVGHSLGAAIAQRTAIAWPDLAERLVLIDGGLPIEPRQPPPVLWLFLTPGLGEAFYTSLRRSQQGAYDTLRPYYYNLDALPEAERAFLRERVWARVWSSSQRRAFLSTLRWLAIEQVFRAGRYRARLATATTPTTILWGSNDLIAPQAAGAAMAALLPRATLQIIAESGHNVQHEQPQELVRLIEHVLTK